MNPMTTVVVVARVLAVWLLVSKSSAETVEYDFIVARENLALDGVLKKGVITVNGRTPGPEIRVRPGDELVVNVKNLNVENGTSIHWHGQHLVSYVLSAS